MVELTANGKAFELPNKGGDIKYTKQVSDIFDLAQIASSYTNGFELPKAPHNTMIMQQLGIVGDTSSIPYEKTPSSLKYHGFPVFNNGWFSVKETDDNYKVHVIDGMVDFFKAIENKTMGVDLDLSNFNHTKDIETVIASFENEFYKYIVGDFNGKNEGVAFSTPGINIDYLVPSFNMGKLLELVMSTFGFTFNDANVTELNDLYISYPKSPEETVTDELYADLTKDNFVKPPVNLGGGLYGVPSEDTWDTIVLNEGTLITNNWRYLIPATGGYKFDLSAEAYALYSKYAVSIGGQNNFTEVLYRPMTVKITINSATVASFQTDPYAAVETTVSQYCNEGDIVEIDMYVTPYSINTVDGVIHVPAYTLREIHHNVTSFQIYRTNQGIISLGDAFKDFQVKDFMKEVFWRTSATPIINNDTSHIIFKSVAERLDTTNAINWGDKYVRRTKETYINGSYAQKNIFHHKYNDENDISQDGYLYVNNKNIDAEKVIVQSKIYAPELLETKFNNTALTQSVTTNKFTVWQRETKEDADGNIEIQYKGLSNRFYILKYKLSPVSTWRFVSEQIIGADTVTQFPYAETQGTTFNQIVPEKYAAYNGVLQNFRAHDIELALTLQDILELDMMRPYYFPQESQFYILNKISFSEGDTSTGEFVRISKNLD